MKWHPLQNHWAILSLLLLPVAALADYRSYPFYYTLNNNLATITGYSSPITPVTIPSTINSYPVVSISANTFNPYYNFLNNQNNATTISIPASVTNIDLYTFANCYQLTTITIATTNPAYSSSSGILFDKNQTTLFQYPRAKAGVSYNVPSTVTNIGPGALFGGGFSSISIPASVLAIAPDALNGCFHLTNITVDPANPVLSGTNGVLFDKNQTSLIAFPGGLSGTYEIPNSVTNIGMDAFAACRTLTNIVMPAALTSVGDVAFQSCEHIADVIFPDGLLTIGHDAFVNCNSLSNIVIPDSVTNLGQWAFAECQGLTRVRIGNQVTCIQSNSFYSCYNLNEVTLGAAVANIQAQAFFSCPYLTDIFCLGNAPMTGAGIFYTSPVTFYYLPGATGWSNSLAGYPSLLWNPAAQTDRGSFGIQSNQFAFTITGTTNIPIVVEASTNFTSAWVPLQSASLTNGSFYFSDPQWTNYPGSFYRIRSP